MAYPSISNKTLREALAVLRRCGGNRAHAAIELGIPYPTLQGRLRRAKARGMNVHPPMNVENPGEPTPRASLLSEVESLRKRADRAERLLKDARSAGRKLKTVVPARKRSEKEDRLRVVWPDLHGSMQDREAVAAFLADVKRLDPDEGIGLGDLFDAGGFLAEHHVWGVVAETSYSFEDDVRASNQFLDAYQAAAPRSSIDLLEGNHEARVEQWCVTQGLRRGVTPQFFMDKFAPEKLLEIKRRGARWFSRSALHDGLGVHGTIRRGKCLFTHEADLRSFARYGANVVHGHDHQMTTHMFSSLESGTLGLWSAGCLSKKAQYWHHARPLNWTQGYCIQVVAKSGAFLNFQVPIVNGISLLPSIKLR